MVFRSSILNYKWLYKKSIIKQMRLPRVINTLAVFLFVPPSFLYRQLLDKILRVLSNLSLYTKKAHKGLNCPMFVHFLRSEEHTSELQSRFDLVCRLLLE